MNNGFKFVDLFSGIGAFHIALEKLGGECVFASEIDKRAIETYFENFHMDSHHDITITDEKDIPAHDVLCAGFPCQAFSTAGHKKGFDDISGTLFFDIVRILNYHKTKYIILENVKNLITHDGGNTWKVMKNNLKQLGYVLTKKPIILSPHNFGIPQLRERVFILGIHENYKTTTGLIKEDDGERFLNIDLKNKCKAKPLTSIYDVIDDLNEQEHEKYSINKYENTVLETWEVFKQNVNSKIIGFPIWAFEFGKSYDYSTYPKWKQEYVRKNREFYETNKTFIDNWLEKYNVLEFNLRDQKFEWQAGKDYDSIWETSIQFRQSGIRCKKPDYFPTLVAIVQTPIIGKYKRRLTPREVSRLQSFPETFILNSDDRTAYKQFGNSANVNIIYFLAKKLLEFKEE